MVLPRTTDKNSIVITWLFVICPNAFAIGIHELNECMWLALTDEDAWVPHCKMKWQPSLNADIIELKEHQIECIG